MKEATTESKTVRKNKFLTFSLDKEVYGLDIQYVTEIIGIQEITRVPELPDYMKGIVNLRGEIIPVMDVRTRLKKECVEYTDRTCIIVVRVEEILIGLIVDTVAEVLIINDENIVSPQELNTVNGNSYIKGIGKVGDNIKLLIDCSKLLKSSDYQAIQAI